MQPLPLLLQSSLFETLAPVAATMGALVLVLLLVALGAFAYKSLRGDGIRWPDETEDPEDGSVRQGSDDDEWKYY